MAKYFKAEEFSCKCGCGENYVDPHFLEMLDEARERAGIPFHVTSGYRCAMHNRAEGGVKASAHTKGLAADIAVNNGSERFAVVRAAMSVGFTRVGIGRTFIHIDNDPSLPDGVVWLYEGGVA